MFVEQRHVLFHATSDFGDDGSWYDWCLVEWVDNEEQCMTYPVKILGFFSIQTSVYVVIQSSSDPITMEQLIDNFIYKIELADDQQPVVVEIKNHQQCIVCLQELWWSFEFVILCTPKEELGVLFWREDSTYVDTFVIHYIINCMFFATLHDLVTSNSLFHTKCSFITYLHLCPAPAFH
jgi:hypothetical protein